MGHEAEDPDKDLQEELQQEEAAQREQKNRRARGRGRGRGRSRGRGTGGRGRGRKKDEDEDKPPSIPQRSAEQDTSSAMEPPATENVNQNDDQKAPEPKKPRSSLARKGSRSKLKRIKCLSPSSSAKKVKTDSTGSTGDICEVDQECAEPMVEGSQPKDDVGEMNNNHDDGTCHDRPEKKPKRKKRKNSAKCRQSSKATKEVGDQGPHEMEEDNDQQEPECLDNETAAEGDRKPTANDDLAGNLDSEERNQDDDKAAKAEEALKREEQEKLNAVKEPYDFLCTT